MKGLEQCIFCHLSRGDIILENDAFVAIYDRLPVSEGHLLIIPKFHVEHYFHLDAIYREQLWSLIDEAKCLLDTEFQPDGFNIGMNIGEVAGQSVMHLHVHLIPRYRGDMRDPKGGVRGVIPGKQNY
ncbi:HIT family protein [Erysipelothrix sp. HDW6C]|nr:HIT family protein [Erysipelothrix sp. HDW6C]